MRNKQNITFLADVCRQRCFEGLKVEPGSKCDERQNVWHKLWNLSPASDSLKHQMLHILKVPAFPF